ncbi:MAG: periplasmic heavy metal sensor [Thermodesulfobacteriota bacterium]|nr:periplasmic heavy metal sensor [Thermodesulfobacteriota bacterium]
MKQKRILISTLLLTFLGAGIAMAWGPGQGMHNRGYNQGDCPGRYSNPYEKSLTAEQQEKLTRLRQAFFKETAEQRIDLDAKTARLGLLLNETKPDETAINKLVEDITTLQKSLLKKRVAHRLAVKEVAPELGGFGRLGTGFGYGMGPGSEYGMHRSLGNGPGRAFGCGGSPGYCWQ